MKKNLLQYVWAGLLTFWIPLTLIIYVIKTIWPVIEKLSKPISRILPFHSIRGEILDSVIGVLIIVLISISVGWIAKKSFLKNWTSKIENMLGLLFPGFSFYKNYLKTNSSENIQNEWKSVIVEDNDELKLGFIIQERKDELCVIYVPGAPNPYEGEIVFKPSSNLRRINIPFSETVKIMRQYGKGFSETYDKFNIPEDTRV
ncbi:MAG: hypothetical protein LBV74_05760 [Tannerella sp.]|jgi:uncharacterized membrane protein|nr:hypothetical protein [Tannerella sp.]